MFKPLQHRKAVTALMTAALALVVMAPSAQAVTTISADLDTDGLLIVDGAVTLGNGTATAAVNTSDWGITTAGAMTGVSFDANGAGNSLSNVDAADLTIDSLDFAQFADALSIDSATVTGTWTDLGSVTTVDINGGSLDGVIIGGASPAAATLTTLSMSDLATWSAGAAITAGSYQIGRDADATNQLHFNVPTGASMEWSVNDTSVMTLSGTGVGIGMVVPTTELDVRRGTWTASLAFEADDAVALTKRVSTATSSGYDYGASDMIQAEPGALSTNIFVGHQGAAYMDSTQTQTINGRLYGASGFTFPRGTGTVLWARATTGNANAGMTAPGVLTNSAGVHAQSNFSGTGTVTNAYGVYVYTGLNSGAGTITNRAAIFAEEPNTGTNQFGLVLGAAATTFPTTGLWSIYNNSTRENFFGGNLTMGNDALIKLDTNAGLVASTTQTQGNGALTAELNEVATVANPNDTVTLPTAVAGLRIVIINDGANTLQIFPASGNDAGSGVNTAITLAATNLLTCYSYNTTNWKCI